MPSFSPESLGKLATLHPDLQQILNTVIATFDFTIVVGYRDQAAQEAAFQAGNSEKHWPDSRHNTMPSEAADLAPYPIDWENRDRFVLLAGRMLAVAESLGTPLRWGGDWRETNLVQKNESLDDLGHFELRKEGSSG